MEEVEDEDLIEAPVICRFRGATDGTADPVCCGRRGRVELDATAPPVPSFVRCSQDENVSSKFDAQVAESGQTRLTRLFSFSISSARCCWSKLSMNGIPSTRNGRRCFDSHSGMSALKSASS